MHVDAPRAGRAWLLATILFASAILTACDKGATEPTMQSVVGRYSLRLINGGALPWVNPAATGPGKVEIMGVQLELSSDGSFEESWQYRITSASGVGYSSYVDYGSFTLMDSELVLLYNTGSPQASGLFSSDRLTVTTQGGSVLTYAKQP